MFNPLVIVKGPEDITAYQEQIAVFTCETVGGDFTGWKVNGTGFTGLPREVQEDLRTSQERLVDSERATLTILTARASYSGTTVQCVTGKYDGDEVESENATLTIQGQSHVRTLRSMQCSHDKITCIGTCTFLHIACTCICTLLIR